MHEILVSFFLRSLPPVTQLNGMDGVNKSAFIHLHAYDAVRWYIDILCYDDLWMQVQRAMNT